MSEVITTHIQVDTKGITQKIENLVDDKLMLQVHELFAKMCEPYVPMGDTQMLSNSGLSHITPQYVHYTQPYSHYIYKGELYLTEDGRAFANFGEKKYPTGIDLNYSQELHPKATKEWDKAMMSEVGDVFLEEVKQLLVRRSKELYG